MAQSTGNFAELLWPGINSLWGQAYNDYETLWTKVFETKTATKAFEKEQGVTGLPLAAVKNQGSPFQYRDLFQGFQKEYVIVTYAIGAAVTYEMFRDDQYNYINSVPEMLARSMRHTEETIAFNVLNNGFSSSYLGADGLSLFNASHIQITGGTFRNQPAVASDLSQTAVETAFIDIMDWTDDQGLRIKVEPKTLAVPTALRFTAQKIMETEFEVNSADNTINPVRGMLNVVVSPFLTDTDQWTMVTDVPNGLTFYNREDASLERDNEFSTRNLLFACFRAFDVSWTDPRGAYGSQGA